MARGYCQICFSYFYIENFRFLRCGHCCCVSCMDILKAKPRPSCPICRDPITKRDGQQIFIVIEDSKVAMANTVAEGLDRMDMDSKPISVERAGEKIEKVAQNIQAEPEVACMLRRAVDDFKDRIIPLFVKVQSQSKQIDALTQDLRESDRDKGILEVEIMNAKPLGTQVKQLKKRLEDAERNSHQAILLAEKAKDEVVQLRQSNITLHATAEELERDNRNLRDLLDRHSNASRVNKEKTRGLKQQVLDLQQQLANLNAQIDAHSMEESLVDIESDEYSTQDYADSDAYTSSQDYSFPRKPSALRSRSCTFSSSKSTTGIPNPPPPQRGFEAMPPPGFASEWQIHALGSKKRKVVDKKASAFFPLELDKKGHPMGAIQLGPKRSRRVQLK